MMEVEDMYALAGAIYRDKFKGCAIERDVLLQEGVIGILRAEKNYDASRGDFRTFAYSYALWGMMDYYNKEKSEVFSCSPLDDYIAVLKCDMVIEDNGYGLDKICEGVFKDEKKKAIVGLYFENKNYSEIGRCVGVSKQRVGKVLAEMKTRVRDKYIYRDDNIMER